jgi:hypothetical protein
MILPISASQVAGIADMSHCTQMNFFKELNLHDIDPLGF